MPKVSHFTQYGTVTPNDHVPFLPAGGGEGLVPATAFNPDYSFKANVRAPFTNAFWIPVDTSPVIADYDPAYFPDYWNHGFTLTGGQIRPTVSGLYLFTTECYANCGAGGGSFDVGSEVLVNATWSNGFAALMVRQTFTAPGDYILNGSFMLRFDLSTAGQFIDRSYVRIIGQSAAPMVNPPALAMYLSCSLLRLL